MPVDDAAPPVGVSRRARRRLGHTQRAIIGHSSISRRQSPVSRQPSAQPGVLASSRRCDRRVPPGCVAAPTRTKDPAEAANLADCVMTDKWISMGEKVNKKKKKKLLKPYQVNKKIMKLAKADAIFMHCLPANRGEEVTNEVIDGKQSVVWLEALNRIHIQKSIIEWCLNN